MNSPLVFRVSTRHSGRRRFVRVTLYDEVAELRRAANRYTRAVGTYTDGEFDRAYGVTHSFVSMFYDEDGTTERLGPGAAHIRLSRGFLGTSVVTHEVAHAALGIYRQDCLEKQGSVHEDMEQEETVCYLIGDLTARIVNRLYAYGCYTETEET
jgi:hypothetical protein